MPRASNGVSYIYINLWTIESPSRRVSPPSPIPPPIAPARLPRPSPSPSLARVSRLASRAPHRSRRRIKSRPSPASVLALVLARALADADVAPARRHRDRAQTGRAKVEESRRPEKRGDLFVRRATSSVRTNNFFPTLPRSRASSRARAPSTHARPSPPARLRQNARENRDCQRLARTHVVRARRDAFRGPTPRVRVHGVTTAIARRLARRRRASASSRRSRARPHRTPSDARRARRVGENTSIDRSIVPRASIDRSTRLDSMSIDRSIDRSTVDLESIARADTWLSFGRLNSTSVDSPSGRGAVVRKVVGDSNGRAVARASERGVDGGCRARGRRGWGRLS